MFANMSSGQPIARLGSFKVDIDEELFSSDDEAEEPMDVDHDVTGVCICVICTAVCLSLHWSSLQLRDPAVSAPGLLCV